MALQLAIAPGSPATTWDDAIHRTRAHLDGQGEVPTTITRDTVPEPNSSSGKYRQVSALPR